MFSKRKQTWILALVKPLMKLGAEGCKCDCNSNTKYILIEDNNSTMIKIHPMHLSANIFVAVIMIIIFYIVEKIVTPVQRGFFCNDQSIMKPYVKNQTVPTGLLTAVATILIVLVVIPVELIKNFWRKGNNVKEQLYVIGHQKIKPWLYEVASRLFFAFVGISMCLLFTDIGKKLVGRLRPHFLAVCNPNYKLFNCTDGYITADVCVPTSLSVLREARLSFPSGHSSTAAFTAVFIVLYVEYSISTKNFSLVKSFVQFVVISLGVACGYTRIADYWHHWSDVLTGFVIGTAFALYTIFALMTLHNLQESESHNVNSKRLADHDIESQPREGYNNEVASYPSIARDE